MSDPKPKKTKKPSRCPCIQFEEDQESEFPSGCYACGHAQEEHRDENNECEVLVEGGR